MFDVEEALNIDQFHRPGDTLFSRGEGPPYGLRSWASAFEWKKRYFFLL